LEYWRLNFNEMLRKLGDDGDFKRKCEKAFKNLKFERANTGRYVAFKDGVALASAYDPEKEADRVVGRYLPRLSVSPNVVVLGGGCGYLIKKLHEKAPDYVKFVIVEPDFERLVADFSCVNLVDFIRNRSFKFILTTNEGFITNHLAENLYPGQGGYPMVLTIRHPVTNSGESKDFFDRAELIIKKLVMSVILNYTTSLASQRVMPFHISESFEELLRLPGVQRLRRRFDGKPGVLVAAGPSLDEEIEKLKRVKDKVIIVAVATAVPALLRAGIEPHFAMAADMFRNSIFSSYGLKYCKNTVMVLSAIVNYDWFRIFKGRKALFNPNNKLISWLERFREEMGFFEVAGTVATGALNFLEYLGCNPIFLVGQDFSEKEGKTHVSGTYHEYITEMSALTEFETFGGLKRLKKLFYKPKLKVSKNGKEYYTTTVYQSYSYQFMKIVEAFEKRGIEVYYASDGILDMEYVDIEEKLAEFPIIETEVRAEIEKLLDEKVKNVDVDGLLEDISEVDKHMDKLESELFRKAEKAYELFERAIAMSFKEKEDLKRELLAFFMGISERWPFMKVVSTNYELYNLLFAKKYFEILEKFEKGEYDVDDMAKEIGRVFIIFFANVLKELRFLRELFEKIRERLLSYSERGAENGNI